MTSTDTHCRLWIPGVLNGLQIGALAESGLILDSVSENIGNSSLDLTVSGEAYELVSGSVKPQGALYLATLKNDGLAKRLEPNSDGEFSLSIRKTYLFKINENIGNLRQHGIYGQATAKSSVGRMDVLARLIVDGMDVYEYFDPMHLATGLMYVEVTPMTFNVVVRPGTPLVQLRFFKGRPQDCEMRGAELYESVLVGSSTDDGSLSVDLTSTDISGNAACAFRASPADPGSNPIPLYKGGARADPTEYWQLEQADSKQRLVIEQNDFYIMRSKERIRLPKGIAVYCRATDETIGEMRIHYAGFVHPFFGERLDEPGTPLIFEIRGHDVNVTLSHGEKMARLVFFRMSEDCHAADVTTYNEQTLKLSAFFSDWPARSA